MKTLAQMGIETPEILLPQNLDLGIWSVIACDQYTQDFSYWEGVQKITQGKPSTFNLILPEIFLEDNRKTRIQKIHSEMQKYLSEGIFSSPKKSFVYVKRTILDGRIRKGLVAAIDLESYDYHADSHALIRATEATISERIPARTEIRKGAALELPHIMLLCNDESDLLFKTCEKIICDSKKNPLYDGKLMCNGGAILGFSLETQNEISKIENAFQKIFDENTNNAGETFLFAVGDGNHSLAAAKAVWQEEKQKLLCEKNENAILNHPLRFALCEIVNIYDSALDFEPIHRVIFGADFKTLSDFLIRKLNASAKEFSNFDDLQKSIANSKNEKNENAKIGIVDGEKNLLLCVPSKELAIIPVQNALDEFSTQNKIDVDFIHGEDEVLRIVKQKSALGVILPPISKTAFFSSINARGSLPRKTFSMGHADEKRFYLESRKISQ